MAFGGLEQEEDSCTQQGKAGYGALRLSFYDAQYHVCHRASCLAVRCSLTCRADFALTARRCCVDCTC